jgi:hypothetical protein
MQHLAIQIIYYYFVLHFSHISTPTANSPIILTKMQNFLSILIPTTSMSKYVTEICDMGQIIRPCIDQNERFDI